MSLIENIMIQKFIKNGILLITALVVSVVSFAQPWTENFDDQSNGSYLSTFTCAISGTWTASQAGNFSLGTDRSAPSCVAINDDKVGAHITTPNLNTCGTVSFYYYARSGSATDEFELQVSENGGVFTTVDTHTYGGTTSPPYTFYSYDVNSSAAQVNIRVLNDDQSAHLIIDDFSVTAYSAGPSAPSATTNIATSITATGATLNGTIDDNGADVTSIVFKYGTSLGGPYGTTVNATPNTLSSGSGATSVSKSLTGLTTNTTYYYVVEATNSEGTTTGSEQNFTPNNCGVAKTIPYTQNFDNDDCWAVTGIWEIGSLTGGPDAPSTGHSGNTVAGTDFNANYSDNLDIYLTSPIFDLAGTTAPILSFWMDLEAESGWDGGTVQIRVNSGSWTTINQGDSGYGGTTPNDSDVDGLQDNEDGWSGNLPASGEWTEVTIDLFNLTTSGLSTISSSDNIEVRFWFGSDGSTGANGWYIDDFSIIESAVTNYPDWCNLQWPANGTISTGDSFDVFAQVYEPGVTDADANAAGTNVECWIGYSTSNDDPSTWTNWIPASYNGADVGNNDEFKADIGTVIASAGTYYYASRFTIDGTNFSYGGYNGDVWDGTTNVNGELTINSNYPDWCNLQSPTSSTISEGTSYDVYAWVYEPGVTDAAGEGTEITAWIGYNTTDTDPSTWTNWIEATYNGDKNGISNDEYIAEIGSTLPAGTYYYASRFTVNGIEYKYGGYSAGGGGYWDGSTYDSQILTINAAVTPKKILFDGTSGQSLGSADWVVDADSWDVSWNSSGVCYTPGTESNPQQNPTPATPTSESDWDGGNSEWAYELFSLGYSIESLGPCQDITYGDGGNPQDLSNYDVFICNEPNVQFTAAEKTALLNFVNAGGGLFMVADHGDNSVEVCGANTEADRNCDGWNSTEVWNDLMSGDPFGIQFDNNNTASPTSTNVIADASDPILHNTYGDVSSISFNQGATMTINTSNNATAKGVVFMTGTPIPATTTAMVSYASYGSGRVVGLGDSSPTGDATGDTNGETRFDNWSDANNSTLIMNATIWLAEGSTRLVVSPSSLTGFTYEEGSGPSANQTFSLDGYGLVGSGNITVTGSTNYEVSTDGSTFANSVTYPYASGIITGQSKTVYVRLKTGLTAGDYNSENIAISGGSASTINVTCNGTVTAPSAALFCDDFEDNLSEWTITNDPAAGAQVEISNTWSGANSTSNAALFNAPNPASTTYYTSSIEKTFTNSKDLSIEFYYYFEDYRGGEVNVLVNSTEVYSIYTETPGDLAIMTSDDDMWTFISLDLSSQTSTFDDYTITIEGVAKTASTWKDRVAIDELCVYGTESFSPTLLSSTASLSGFTYIQGSGPSAEQSFDLSGTNLDGSNVTITPTTNFEISQTSGSGFQSSAITLSAYDGTSTTIYVRLKAGLAVNTYGSENITIAGGGATTINVTCNGEVTAPDITAPTVTTFNPADESTGVSISSDLILTFNENVQKGTGNIYIKLVSDNSTVQTIDVTDAVVTVSNDEVTINPPSDLSTLTAYYITIDSGAIKDLANNDYTGISASTTWNFTTADVVSTTTCINEDFESGLPTAYVTGFKPLNDGNWEFKDGGYKKTGIGRDVVACQIKNDAAAYAATPILYNAQSVTFWYYDQNIPIVKYGTTVQTVNTLVSGGAGAWSQYSVDINASTSDRIYFYTDGFTGYLDDVSTICEVEPCIPPVFTVQPSTTDVTYCKSTAATALSVTASPATSYQWYYNTSASNSGGTLLSGATSDTYTPVTSTSHATAWYYYCEVTNSPSTCTTNSDVSGAIIVVANPTISGTLSVCEGSTTSLSGTDTPAASNPWVSSQTGTATVDNSGVVTGVAAGTTDITYTTNNGCVAIETVTVDPGTPTISGTATVCVGSTTTLTGTPTGGTWSSDDLLLATVNSTTGVVTGEATGSPTITYTTGCGSENQIVTINIRPAISGTLAVCGSSTTTLTGTPAGGSWSSSDTGVATIDASGEVTGISSGTTTITYTALTGCETTETVTVSAPVISGSTSVTIGGTTTLTGDPAGGTWSSATPANATIDAATGLVTGVANGTSLITYSVGGCDATTTVTSSTGPCLGPEGFTGTTAPAGWTFTDITSTYTSGAYYGDASPSLKLEDTDQIIETPSFTNASELSFYCFVQFGYTSELLIEGWDGSSWLTVDNNTSLPQSDATANITYNASSTPALEPGFTKFRFTFTKISGNAAFDDVTVNCTPLFHEIGLSGNGNAIIDGDLTPAASDFTDFGSAAVTGETVDRTFTIHNFGSEDLSLTGSPLVEATGDFTVTSQPSSSTVSAGGTLTFTIQFDPTATGTRTGTVSIANDDTNESIYDFAIQGEGLASSSPWLIDEKFDGVSSMATITNTNTTGFTVSGTGTISASTSANGFNRSANALTFLGAAGSTVTITTPVFANADMISFWYKQPNASSANPFVIEQYSPAKAGWTTLATISGGAESMKPAVYFYPLSADITQIRFTYTRTSNLYQGYLDDVRIRKASYCTSDIKIIQTLIQSCGGGEGINESVIFKTGDDAVDINDLSVSFPNVGVGGTEYSMESDQGFVSNAGYITDLNDLVQLTYPACSPVLAPPSGIIPANSYAVIFTGSSPSVTYDFKDACISGTNYYAIFCDNTNTSGRYGNTPVAGEKDYTAIIDKATGCYDSQHYDIGIPNAPGALAAYDETTRVRSYENNSCEIITLPVELKSFDAKCENGLVNISWSTATETNNDYFSLQKSNNGVNWYELAIIDGAGNSTEMEYYNYADNQVENKISYYRLKQVDYDGNFQYSNIISNSCFNLDRAEIILYPNPCNEILNITIENWTSESIKFEITNTVGQIIYSGKIENTADYNLTQINTDIFNTGLFFIRFSDKTQSLTKKFVKQ